MTKNECYPAKSSDLETLNTMINYHNAGDNLSYKPCNFSINDIIETDRNIVFLYKVKDMLAGYLWLYSDQPFKNVNCEANIIIVVAPIFRRAGIGKELMSFIIEYVKKNTSINKLIAVIKYDNVAPKRLSENFNFRIKHENGFGLTMVLTLKR